MKSTGRTFASVAIASVMVFGGMSRGDDATFAQAHQEPGRSIDTISTKDDLIIAAEGPRRPDVDHAQKQFNTGIVVIVEHGKTPSQALIERANGIRERWIDYFATTTGHRASMTAKPR